MVAGENFRCIAIFSIKIPLLWQGFCNFVIDPGLTGFDSKMSGYVSMPSKAIQLVKLKCKQLNGENNYALAA
jgi:hypothetical protein